jgi:hypothetical protein
MGIIESLKKTPDKCTVEEFWDLLSRKENVTIEVRVLAGEKEVDYGYLRAFGENHNIVVYGSSFFVRSAAQLRAIVENSQIVENYNVYYGINPRRNVFTYSKKYNKAYQRPGSKLEGVKSINVVPFDIEAVDRKGLATEDQMRKAMLFAGSLAKSFGDYYGWNDHVAIWSGNGIHLLLFLDKPIDLPELEYVVDHEKKEVRYDIYGKEFMKKSRLVNSFLKKVATRSQRVDPESSTSSWIYGAKFDFVGDLSRVMRLPFTKNNKKENIDKRPCKVLSVKKGLNKNLHKVLLKERANIHNIIIPKSSHFDPQHAYTKDNIVSAPIVKLLLRKNLPEGGRNHYLEFQLSLLLRDNGIDVGEISSLVSEINSAQSKKVNLSPRHLKEGDHFNQDVVNNWCIINMIDPIYPLLEKRAIQHRFLNKNLSYNPKLGLLMSKDWPECLDDFQKRLRKKYLTAFEERLIWSECISMLNATKGIPFTKFVVENGILKRYLET